MLNDRREAVCGDHAPDLLDRVEMAAHQSEFFARGNELRAKALNIRFLNQQLPAGLQHPQSIFNGFTLMAKMM